MERALLPAFVEAKVAAGCADVNVPQGHVFAEKAAILAIIFSQGTGPRRRETHLRKGGDLSHKRCMITNGSFFLRIKLIGLVVFLIGGGISLGYAVLYQWPKQECESKGGWYTFKYRKCAYPVYLPTLTGRKAGEPRKVIWPGDKPPQKAPAEQQPKPTDTKAP
ncbi:MAG: hypothetical protein ACK41P_03345 [Asticcacaulis sp.]